MSIPIFQFLTLRWLYRLLLWFLFLWRVSRLDLRLAPSHPDRAGGLGFLDVVAGKARELLDPLLEVAKRRFEVGLSTSFLVTQAQRDLLQAEVNLLQAMLDHQSALVRFDALQEAPELNQVDAVGSRGAEIAPLSVSAPRGIFREGSGSGF